MLHDVTAFVCCRADDAAQRVLTSQLKALGAKVSLRIGKDVTHIIYQRKLDAQPGKERVALEAELRCVYDKVAKEKRFIVHKPIRPAFPAPPTISEAGVNCGVKRPRRKSAIVPRDPSTYECDVTAPNFSSSQQIQHLSDALDGTEDKDEVNDGGRKPKRQRRYSAAAASSAAAPVVCLTIDEDSNSSPPAAPGLSKCAHNKIMPPPDSPAAATRSKSNRTWTQPTMHQFMGFGRAVASADGGFVDPPQQQQHAARAATSTDTFLSPSPSIDLCGGAHLSSLSTRLTPSRSTVRRSVSAAVRLPANTLNTATGRANSESMDLIKEDSSLQPGSRHNLQDTLSSPTRRKVHSELAAPVSARRRRNVAWAETPPGSPKPNIPETTFLHIPDSSAALAGCSISGKTRIATQVDTTASTAAASGTEPSRRRSAGVGDRPAVRVAAPFQAKTPTTVGQKSVRNTGTPEMVAALLRQSLLGGSGLHLTPSTSIRSIKAPKLKETGGTSTPGIAVRTQVVAPSGVQSAADAGSLLAAPTNNTGAPAVLNACTGSGSANAVLFEPSHQKMTVPMMTRQRTPCQQQQQSPLILGTTVTISADTPSIKPPPPSPGSVLRRSSRHPMSPSPFQQTLTNLTPSGPSLQAGPLLTLKPALKLPVPPQQSPAPTPHMLAAPRSSSRLAHTRPVTLSLTIPSLQTSPISTPGKSKPVAPDGQSAPSTPISLMRNLRSTAAHPSLQRTAAASLTQLHQSEQQPEQQQLQQQQPQFEQQQQPTPKHRRGRDSPCPASPIVLSSIGGTPLSSPRYYTRLQRQRFLNIGVDLEQLQPGQEFVLQPDGKILPTPMRLAAAAAGARAVMIDDEVGVMSGADDVSKSQGEADVVCVLNPLFGSLLESLAARGASAGPPSAKCRPSSVKRSLKWLEEEEADANGSAAVPLLQLPHSLCEPKPCSTNTTKTPRLTSSASELNADQQTAKPAAGHTPQRDKTQQQLQQQQLQQHHDGYDSPIRPQLPASPSGRSPSQRLLAQSALHRRLPPPLLPVPEGDECLPAQPSPITSIPIANLNLILNQVSNPPQPDPKRASSRGISQILSTPAAAAANTEVSVRRQATGLSPGGVPCLTSKQAVRIRADAVFTRTTASPTCHASFSAKQSTASTPGRLNTRSLAVAAHSPFTSGLSKTTGVGQAQQQQSQSQLIPHSSSHVPTLACSGPNLAQPGDFSSNPSGATPAEVVFAGVPVLQPVTQQPVTQQAVTQQTGPSSSSGQRGKAHPMRAGVRYFAATSLEPHQLALLHQAIAQLGKARLCTEGWEDGHITHLVVGAERRTLKMLIAVANGAHLVSVAWLIACLGAKRWLPEDGPGHTAQVRFAATSAIVRQRLTLGGPLARPLHGYAITIHCQPLTLFTPQPSTTSSSSLHASQASDNTALGAPGSSLGAGRMKGNEHRAGLEKLVVSLGGRIVPIKSCNLCVVVHTSSSNGTMHRPMQAPLAAAVTAMAAASSQHARGLGTPVHPSTAGEREGGLPATRSNLQTNGKDGVDSPGDASVARGDCSGAHSVSQLTSGHSSGAGLGAARDVLRSSVEIAACEAPAMEPLRRPASLPYGVTMVHEQWLLSVAETHVVMNPGQQPT